MARINNIQTSFQYGEIAPILLGRTDVESYVYSCKTLLNWIVTPYGGITRRPGFYYIADSIDSSKKTVLIPFIFSAIQSYAIELSAGKIRFYKDQGIILDSNTVGTPIYSINSPYTEAQLENIRYAQSFDTLYLVNDEVAPHKLTRIDHDNWVLSPVVFDEPAWLDENTSSRTLQFSATSGTGVTCTASAATFVSTDVGRAIRVKTGPDLSDRVYYSGTNAQTFFEIPFFPQGPGDLQVFFIETNGSRTSKSYTSGTPAAGQFTIVGGQVRTGDVASTSQRVEIRPINAGSGQWGWAIITGFTSSTVVTVTIISPIGGTNATRMWRLGAFSQTTGYPSLVTFFEQRLWFGATPFQPNTIYGSCSADFENFSPDASSFTGNLTPDSALTYTLDVPSIQWMRGVKALLIGTNDGILQIFGANGGLSAIESPRTQKDTNIFCQFSPIATTDREVLFIEELGKRVHTVSFDDNAGGYVNNEITVLAPHMSAKGKFVSLAYADIPNRLLWAITDQGKLRCCTYAPGQKIIAWHQHEVGGTNVAVESICTIPGETYTELWAVIKRTINGQTKRYIEVMQDVFNEDRKEDAFFVDSGLFYEGPALTTFSNLDHLEGETLKVNIKGGTHPDVTVVGGSITLNLATTVASAGLGYASVFESVNLTTNTKIGTAEGAISRVTELALRLHETIGLKSGSSLTNLEALPFRQAGTPFNNSPDLYTGLKKIKFNKGNDSESRVFLVKDDTLPASILSIVYKMDFSID